MIDIQKIPSLLCSNLMQETHQVAGKLCIVTPMSYPNGDSINIYFDRVGNDVIATDEGATTDNLANRGIRMTAERQAFVRTVCRTRGTSFSMPTIAKVLNRRSIQEDVFAFCQTLTDVSGLHYHANRPERSHFHAAVDSLVQSKIATAAKVDQKWTAKAIDPRGSFPVDYHVNKDGSARNLFYVTSNAKALLVTAVSHFLLSHEIRIPTLAVLDTEAELKGRHMDRLQFASDKILVGLKGNEHKIVRFALGAAA